MNKHQQSGFTLVELMVALAIFAVVSAASFVGLNSAIRSYTFFTRVAQAEAQAQVFIALITKDFLQIAPRVVRDGNGDYQPAFRLGGNYLVSFSRSGLPILGASTGLSRVAYELEKDKLWRYNWPFLDNIRTTEPSKSLILEDIDTLSITAIDESLQTQKIWPKTLTFDNSAFAIVPQALEVKVKITGEGEITRFIPGVSEVYKPTKDTQERSDDRSNIGADSDNDQQENRATDQSSDGDSGQPRGTNAHQ